MSFNFETPSSGEDKKQESKKEEQSILERLYKSKSARAIAFAAALFGVGATVEGFKNAKNEATIAGAVENNELKLEGLATKFNAEIKVPGGDKTILHIGQKHGEDSLKESKEKNVNEIIYSQKNIEELLTYLKDKGLADTVYAEGATEEFMEMLNEPKHMSREHILDAIKILNSSSLGYSERRQASWLYSAKCELSHRAIDLEHKYQESLKKGTAETGLLSLIETLKKDVAEIGNDERIKGDNVYVWGAVFKMYSEGKMNVRPAETVEAEDATMAPYTLKESIPAVLDAGYKPAFRHQIRENAALDLIAKDAPTLTEKIIPLVCGSSHNFEGVVRDWDKKSEGTKLGLTKAMPREGK